MFLGKRLRRLMRINCAFVYPSIMFILHSYAFLLSIIHHTELKYRFAVKFFSGL